MKAATKLTTVSAQTALADMAREFKEQADADSLKLYYLQRMMMLTAFATEARRVLQGIDEAITYQPEMKAVISDRVKSCSSWDEYEDVTGDVLQKLAQDLDELNTEMTDRAYAMARRLEKVTV